MTFSYADNHLDDLHRLMPGPKADSDNRKRKNFLNNPHLVDWYFSFRLEEFFKAFLDNALDCDWRWHRQDSLLTDVKINELKPYQTVAKHIKANELN